MSERSGARKRPLRDQRLVHVVRLLQQEADDRKVDRHDLASRAYCAVTLRIMKMSSVSPIRPFALARLNGRAAITALRKDKFARRPLLQGWLNDLDMFERPGLAGDGRLMERIGIFLQAVELPLRIKVENVTELSGKLFTRRSTGAAISTGADHIVARVDQLLKVDLETPKVSQGRREHSVSHCREAPVGVARAIEAALGLIPYKVLADALFESLEVASIERVI